MNQYSLFQKTQLWLVLFLFGLISPLTASVAGTISQMPLFLGGAASIPLVMLVMGRDHKLYYEAYNDASDLNGDGILDVGYKPDKITYFGYFDSNKCYTYSGDLFAPSGAASNKKCSGQWSGDFLNYLTTSRMDALRKVLFGGYRSTDTAGETILERSFIPQDAHSWGKEYTSETVDGYKISDYTPYAAPLVDQADGLIRHHLFANTTPLCPGNYSDPACSDKDGLPLLRVAQNSIFRTWEWVSIERPVAGTKCATGNNKRADCVTGNIMGTWSKVPDSAFSGLTRTYYKTNQSALYKDGSGIDRSCKESPQSHAEFENFLTSCKGVQLGTTDSATVIDCKTSGTSVICYPDSSNKDHFITVFEGEFKAPTSNFYQLGVDGDDAVEILLVDSDGNSQELSGYYKEHGFCGKSLEQCQKPLGGDTLEAGKSYKFRFIHQHKTGTEGYALSWRAANGQSTMDDYVVRVKVCATNDTDCRGYPVDNPAIYKPAGLLQQYGEDDPERMAFGLISGSYTKNTSGGVLRKNIGPFANPTDDDAEVDPKTGVFKTKDSALIPGVVASLSTLKILGFGGNYEYGSLGGKGCGWITTRAIQEGECRMWGNPIGEMMYEGLRYFAGKPKPTPAYDYTDSGSVDATLKLPKPNWKYPFYNKDSNPKGYKGSKCFLLTIGDITPSFDTDQVPGIYSAFGTFSGDLEVKASENADKIWNGEPDDKANNVKFIGQSGSNSDGAPTPKTVSGFGSIRGLAPEEPTKQGGFYSSAVAYFGNTQGIGGVAGKQRVENLSVVLASPLPRIEIPVDGKVITLVPFAKSVGGSSIDPAQGKFQPTNQIVDFYVEKIDYADPDNGGRPHGSFRINYEDVEQGADHDMDAIVRYEFWVLADNTVKLTLSSTYAAGGIIQHMGYVVSGTKDQDGVYLDVRDSDTGSGSDPDYYLDTPVAATTDTVPTSSTYQHTLPRSTWPTDYWKHQGSSGPLPLEITRIFKPGTTTTAQYIKHDPLWYAAKWGGFNDANKNGIPDAGEWDSDIKGTPDNYYLVTNAGKLKEQLSKAFKKILSKTGTATVTAVNAGKAFGDDDIFQAGYNSKDWSGTLLSLLPSFSATGQYKEVVNWDAGEEINALSPDSRNILTYKPSEKEGVKFTWPSDPESPLSTELDKVQAQALSLPLKADGTYDYALGKLRLEFLSGDDSNEGTTSDKFRKRSSRLGDIVNSSPIYVGAPSTRYSDTMEASDPSKPTDKEKYSTFRNTDRKPMIYVGANDGMLHGFDAKTGVETIAYVPSPVYPNLSLLTKQGYKTPDVGDALHHFYVDGGLHVGDAFFNGDWRSVLIGRLGAGGQGVFALNVSKPDKFSGNDTSVVLWEFTDANDIDLGYTFGRSWVVKTNTTATNTTAGTWAAIFGNGYNSEEADSHTGSGKGVLYMVNVADGTLIKKIEATDPTAKEADGTTVISGGLSTPYPYDVDDDNKVDWIYAGDMKGNLWKFDVSDEDTTKWKAKLLFTARATGTDGKPIIGTDGKPTMQPITTMPLTLNNPEGGVLVLFGTGSYLFNNDPNTTDTQSYYAIWDQESWGADLKPGTNDSGEVGFVVVGRGADGKETTPRSSLLKQTFNTSVTFEGNTYRTSSDNTICWIKEGCPIEGETDPQSQNLGWYIDLPFTGERVAYESRLDKGRVVFGSNATTAKNPNATIDPCESQETDDKSWLNMLDAISGSRLSTSFLKRKTDTTLEPIKVPSPDGTTKIAPSSLERAGRKPGPSDLLDTDNSKVILIPGEAIEIEKGEGRQSWRQVTQ